MYKSILISFMMLKPMIKGLPMDNIFQGGIANGLYISGRDCQWIIYFSVGLLKDYIFQGGIANG